MYVSRILVLAASISAATAQVKGFNYGSTFTNGAPKQQFDFEAEFSTASELVGAPGFTSARLFTTIQAGTANTPISAIPAAIATNTSLLLGLWASAGQANFNNELAALTSAITQYGTAFTDLIVGISVGSEDLYRISPTGILNESGVGASPDEIVNYIGQTRSAITGTLAAAKPVGHVDTWTAWVNGTNSPVISASDFLGLDAYPYFQNTQANSIENGNSLFFAAYDATAAVSAGKPIWVTETGWPVSGPTENQAVPSIPNAQRYWDEVGCSLFGTTNTWWYTLQDAAPDTPSPSFGVVGSTLSTTPLFDLTCPAGTPGDAPSSASSSATPSAPISSVASPTAPASTAAGASILSSAPNPVPSAGGAAPVSSVGSSAQAPAPSAAPAPSEAASSAAGPGSAPVTAPASAASNPAPAPSSGAQAPGSAAPAPSAPAASSCPASLSGTFEFPHLIVLVDRTQPGTAFGTSYNGEFSPSVSSLFNFDLLASYAGRTCSLVFLLPTQAQLQTSSFTLSGSGGLSISQLQSPATQSTTYSSVPAGTSVGGVESVQPGNSYVIASGPCAAGQTVGYEVSATGDLNLRYFQNYGSTPIGLYVTVC